MTNTQDDFWCVIPAGGAGTRLWPLSRSGAPKFLHDLMGTGRTLIQSTVDRLEPLAGDHLLVVTGRRHVEAVAEQVPQVARGRLLAEPSPRDSMAAIGWAAAVVEQQDPDAIIGSFAADHVIGEEARFRELVEQAVAVAREGYVVTLGIEPTYPATGFGYIREGDALGVEGAPDAHAVVEFVEKPDLPTAEKYLATGEYRWNAGMFVVKAKVLLDLLATWHPELTAGLRRIAADPSRLDEEWDSLERIAIDHAVAEPAAAAGRVAVVRCDVPWDDIGDFHSLAGLLATASAVDDARADGGSTSDAGTGDTALHTVGTADVVSVDSTGIVASRTGRLVSVIGMDDVVVVDTPDALLVTTRGRAQHVKGVVDTLKASGRTDLT
ncbi:mannose-1-phosphate guanylyltransferase [Mobilicoccus pelagius]|uniref:Putative mannose-1-phosphate guanylyltransferase n=1 Tax=Mobilicoccus pelagius NBRC 104925 TaxID=1089455 RepID=H5UU14_9MICO|nr:mannose-1-phosphate guanylyltransferase [Mobilicoccus pelagius]GAB49222.1 putative mannose-1-phosphate guanylyltransferase [Mobilicoccus pelagius NBRC 104925]